MTRSETEHISQFDDFTEKEYRSLLQRAQARYSFVRFPDAGQPQSILWRHDVDISMHRASRLAQIEFDEGVPATYFVFLRSPFLNLLSPQVSEQVRKILSLGHDLALHFDPTFYSDPTSDDCVSRIEYERDVLADEFGQVATAISFHNFGALDPGLFANDIIAGMVNAYGKTLRDTHGYVSDSNGVWLHRRLKSVLEEAKEDRLQVLTHPEWWTPEVMPPRLRVQRAIDGQAAAIGQWYDEAVAKHGRPNFR